MTAELMQRAFDCATPAETVVADARAGSLGSVARLAAVLGQARPLQDLDASVARWGADPDARELLARWAQEAVLRGHPVHALAGVAAWCATLDHPLRELPLLLSPVEQRLPRGCWSYHPSGAGSRVVPDAPPHTRDDRRAPGLETLDGERVGDAEAELAAAGFAGARVFALRAPLAGHHPDRTLLFALGIGGLEEVARRRVRHHRITAPDAVERIFAAAHGVHGAGNATARLRTFRAVAALVGGPVATAMERAAASDWSWIRGFVPKGALALYEMGVVVVSPERTRVGGVVEWLVD